MTPELVSLLQSYGPWVFVFYILIKDVLPKLAPQLFKYLSAKQSTEDRLFKLLEDNNKALSELSNSLNALNFAIMKLDSRVDKLEDSLADNDSTQFMRWFRSLPAYRELQESERATKS